MLPIRANIRKPGLVLSIALITIALSSAVFANTTKNKLPQPNPPSISLSPDSDADEIRRNIAKYAKSIDEADTTLASQIWSDSPEVSFIHPLGHEHGLAQIEQNVYQHLMGETFSERQLTPRDISVQVYGDDAWAEFYWDFAAKFRKDGSPITTHGRETQIYRKQQGAWSTSTILVYPSRNNAKVSELTLPPRPSFRTKQADLFFPFAPANGSACAERNLSSSSPQQSLSFRAEQADFFFPVAPVYPVLFPRGDGSARAVEDLCAIARPSRDESLLLLLGPLAKFRKYAFDIRY